MFKKWARPHKADLLLACNSVSQLFGTCKEDVELFLSSNIGSCEQAEQGKAKNVQTFKSHIALIIIYGTTVSYTSNVDRLLLLQVH